MSLMAWLLTLYNIASLDMEIAGRYQNIECLQSKSMTKLDLWKDMSKFKMLASPNEIRIVIVERYMGTFDSSFENCSDLRFVKVPTSSVSEENIEMLKRLSAKPFVAALDAAFTKMGDFVSDEMAETHGVTHDSEKFMNMLGVHMTLEEAEKQYSEWPDDAKHEPFDPNDFKVVAADALERNKWKRFFDKAEILSSLSQGYAELDRAVAPGFGWTVHIVAHAYPNMNHAQYIDDKENEDYKYRTMPLKECRFSDAEGIY